MKVLALPRDRNPYQGRLYGALARLGAEVRYAGDLTPSQSLNLLLLPIELLVRRLAGWRILHVHWVFGFAPRWVAVVPFGRRLAQGWFGLVLGVARLLGVRVVWTAHNALPHGRVFHDDVRARRWLVRASRLVLAHSEATLSELAEIGAPPRSHEVVPHGPLGPSLDAGELREPGSGEVPRTLLFFGKVLEYKGVEELLEAVAELPDSVSIELTVAGECPNDDLRRRLEELAARAGDRALLRLEYLEDGELTRLIAEADVVVLPFRRVTTSGSVLHAMAHKRPLVLPDLPAFADLPVQAVVRYDASVGGLAQAIEEVTRWTPEQLQRAGRAAADHAARTSWSAVAEKTARAFDSMGDERAGASLLRSAAGRILGDDQYRGSLLLLLNTALLALFGFVFWAVAARAYEASSLGAFSAVTSSATLLGAVAALGLPNTLIRHLPASRHARELILMVLSATVALGGVLCLAVVLVIGPHVPASMHLSTTGRGAVLLVSLVVLTSASGATDAGLIALRSGRAVVLKNLAGSVLKVAALLPLTGLSTNGLVLAYALGTGLSTFLGVGALWRRLPRTWSPRAGLVEFRRYLSFSLGSYAGMVIGILPLTVMPLLIVLERGAKEAGWFAPALLLVSFLNFIPSTASQVFFAEASRAGDEPIKQYVVKALRAIYGLLVPGMLLLAAAAPFLLALFGPDFVREATTSLRLLAFGTLFTGGTYLVDAILTARDRMRAYVFMNVANTVLVLAAVGVLLPYGLSAAAFGWAVAQGASLAVGAVVLVVTGLWRPGGAAGRARQEPERERSGTTSLGLARLGFLDGLRGLAATYVVVSHAWDTIFPGVRTTHSRAGTLTSFLGFGRYAVALFIIISGFSLGLAAWKKGLRWPGGARAFAYRRLRRIYPPYIAAVVLSSLVGATLLATPSGTLYDGAIPIRVSGVLVHAGLLQDVTWRGPAGSTAFWSIAVEFHIYFFFLLLLVAMRRRAWAWAPAVVGLVSLTVFSYMSPGVHVLHKLAGLSPSLYALFVLGVAGARFAVPGCRPDRRRWELFLVALLVAAVAIEIACRSRFDPLGPLNDLWLGPLAALVVCRIADGDLRRLGRFLASRPMVWLGSSSYSLYLIHPFLLEMVWRWAVRPLGLPQLQALAVELVVGVSVSIAASRAFYRFIEQPFLGTSAPTVETPVASAHEARGRFLRRPAPEPVKTS